MTATKLIATFFGAGLLKPAPGTWGSLAALPAAYILHLIGGFPVLAVATIAVIFVGIWATKQETAGKADHDPGEIVIDEVAGMWIALWPVSFGAGFAETTMLALYPGIIVAFLAFRAFDITKPGPVGWADRRNDAVGVMLDDVIAGVFAALTVVAFGVIYHIVWV
ncbi:MULTISPECIES: phosphatidylglycerophosphatase A [Halocynthiibacter]|uniref:Phosphatidylglycerophosphatase A n=1 Tax=Halocynthiibacter halioticoli TaxID=2986804 RepID=A0AAE3LRB0_9RHOB|nr:MULTISPECIES: phosphatidylglycerophosphatase A [Halocynthiibacter]MCV6824398.1 phosphatidylglycerophosphatase A [Halocynthiibacter halioticoli]MCW4057399.1 phosphatidylglycerophosphatase A [Halocynthiibacter sp. SDUM655004]MDE0589563.1 phosphatidylglycerophosphatase A [Halocynthiibacter sp. C4]